MIIDESNDRLQLARIANRILDDCTAGHEDILLGPSSRLGLHGEIDAAVTENPAALLGELDHGALRIEEEEVLGVGDGERGVRLFGAVCDFAADGSDQDLHHHNISYPPPRNSTRQGILTFENSAKSSEGTRSEFVSRHTLS